MFVKVSQFLNKYQRRHSPATLYQKPLTLFTVSSVMGLKKFKHDTSSAGSVSIFRKKLGKRATDLCLSWPNSKLYLMTLLNACWTPSIDVRCSANLLYVQASISDCGYCRSPTSCFSVHANYEQRQLALAQDRFLTHLTNSLFLIHPTTRCRTKLSRAVDSVIK